MSDEGDDKKELDEVNQCLRIDRKKVENGTVGYGRFLLEDGQLRANRVGEDIKDGIEGGVVRPGIVGQLLPQSQPQQPPQGAAVCWERFLHLRSLRVLLVEYDDSTRHVVAALLRNCSYEVVEAANGLQAWKILDDLTNRIDLVLTEVVMPGLSGVALLCKIMSHKTWKNVPVIMMSSHDSMGLVFKCLSKGAVDFLVKPIRKNELKNLWQHVWRRCHSSSGSGSESGTQTQKSVKSKSAEKSENNSGSNDKEDNGSPALNFGEESDHGSGTQSSWTKQAVEDEDEDEVEVNSPRTVSPLQELPECPDSTCAQVVNLNAKPPEIEQLSLTATKECRDPIPLSENPKMEKASDTGPPKNSDLQPGFPVDAPTELSSMDQCSAPKLYSSQYSERIDSRMGEFIETKYSVMGEKISQTPEIIDKVIDEKKELPCIEQSLKRLRGSQDTGKPVHDDRNVLRRSESSAFSRYNAALHNKVSITDAQSPTPSENGLEKKSELRNNIQSHSGSNAPHQCSYGGSFYIDITSISNNRLTETIVLKEKITETPTNKNLYPSEFRDLKESGESSSRQQDNDDPKAAEMILPPVQRLPSNHENLMFKKMAEYIPHCGSSTALGGHPEGNAGNYSVNGSASGSNGPNGSCSAANVGVLKMETNNGVGDKSGSGDASGSGSGSGGGSKLDQSKLAQRAAALTKFRQKRKERCFKRKVRYQSRRRLAEQRPRVRGQFVRQAPPENTSKDTNS